MGKILFIIALLGALTGCSTADLDATCERHATFTDYHGHTHVTHTCKDGLYLDGEFYGAS